jgi:hypothetical protein
MDDEKKTPPTCPSGDELRAGPDLGDGSRPFVRHTADHKIIAGIMTPAPAQEGQPMASGAFHLEHIDGDRYKVEELPTGHVPDAGTKGPAKVNSRAFRENFDSIFGKKIPVGEA